MKDAARRLVATYASDHADDLDGVVVAGRADVILDCEGGVPTAPAIVDYKTSTTVAAADHALQLQVYADAGRREGLDVRAGYVHDLRAGRRDTVDVDAAAVGSAELVVADAAARLRARYYVANPGPRCRRCEVRTVCRHALP